MKSLAPSIDSGIFRMVERFESAFSHPASPVLRLNEQVQHFLSSPAAQEALIKHSRLDPDSIDSITINFGQTVGAGHSRAAIPIDVKFMHGKACTSIRVCMKVYDPLSCGTTATPGDFMRGKDNEVLIGQKLAESPYSGSFSHVLAHFSGHAGLVLSLENFVSGTLLKDALRTRFAEVLPVIPRTLDIFCDVWSTLKVPSPQFPYTPIGVMYDSAADDILVSGLGKNIRPVFVDAHNGIHCGGVEKLELGIARLLAECWWHSPNGSNSLLLKTLPEQKILETLTKVVGGTATSTWEQIQYKLSELQCHTYSSEQHLPWLPR